MLATPLPAAVCFVGVRSLAEGGCGGQQYSSQLPRVDRGLFGPCSLLPAADAFLLPIFRGAVMGPNVTSLLPLFFLGPVMKASLLGGIWGLNKAAAEEFQHENWSSVLLLTLREVKREASRSPFQLQQMQQGESFCLCSRLQLFLPCCSCDNLIL